MLNKILFIIALGLLLSANGTQAQTTPAQAAKIRGKVIAVRVEGTVSYSPKSGGASTVLHSGDVFYDGTEVITGPGASVVLVFDNGARLNVAGDSTLDVDQFVLDPFATPEKVSDLKSEPSTSVTRLSLARGELVGKVAHLNIDKGSEFTVQTPVGAAGIRGTTFQIIYTPSSDGKAFFTVLTSEGQVVFTGTTSAPLNIPAGKQVVVTFSVTTASNGTPVASTPVVVTNASPTSLTQIEAISQGIIQATLSSTVSTGSGGTSGTPPPTTPPNNTPSNPVPAAAQPTPGAGSS